MVVRGRSANCTDGVRSRARWEEHPDAPRPEKDARIDVLQAPRLLPDPLGAVSTDAEPEVAAPIGLVGPCTDGAGHTDASAIRNQVDGLLRGEAAESHPTIANG